MTQLEADTAECLRRGLMTPVEFEEFWREYDRLLFGVREAMEDMGVQRLFVRREKI